MAVVLDHPDATITFDLKEGGRNIPPNARITGKAAREARRALRPVVERRPPLRSQGRALPSVRGQTPNGGRDSSAARPFGI
jgi:hypothetical protein